MYSIELTIAADSHLVSVFRAIKRFDENALMGPTLELLRSEQPLHIHIDRPDRTSLLTRLLELLEELEALHISYSIAINNVPPPKPGAPSPYWKPRSGNKSDLVSELEDASQQAAAREIAAETLKDYTPPEPPPSYKLLHERWQELDFDDLLPSEQNYVRVWALRAEVQNGGFATYFHNSSGDHAHETAAALHSIGSTDVLEIHSDAIELLTSIGEFKVHRAERWEALAKLADDAFVELNSRFYDTAEDVVGMALRAVELDYESRGMLPGS